MTAQESNHTRIQVLEKTHSVIEGLRIIRDNVTSIEEELKRHRSAHVAFEELSTMTGKCIQDTSIAILSAATLREQQVRLNSLMAQPDSRLDFQDAQESLLELQSQSSALFGALSSIKGSFHDMQVLVHRLDNSNQRPTRPWWHKVLFGVAVALAVTFVILAATPAIPVVAVVGVGLACAGAGAAASATSSNWGSVDCHITSSRETLNHIISFREDLQCALRSISSELRTRELNHSTSSMQMRIQELEEQLREFATAPVFTLASLTDQKLRRDSESK